MHLLVLGGTRFVGRAVVDHALAIGAEVTLFNRGQTAPQLYPDVDTVLGDRTVDLSPLAGRRFDLVVDCAGYDPAVVTRSADALRDAVDRYVFVSSVSVYADQTVRRSRARPFSPTTRTAAGRRPASASSSTGTATGRCWPGRA